MRISTPTNKHIIELMSWFHNENELKIWSGPNFRYPFNEETFTEDLSIKRLDSFSLISEKNELIGFGQCYLRLGRCHLGRLVVSPKQRGKGLVLNLISLLSNFGMNKFNVEACSLFVLEENTPAIKAYKRIGFIATDYPETIPLDNCLYMVKEL